MRFNILPFLAWHVTIWLYKDPLLHLWAFSKWWTHGHCPSKPALWGYFRSPSDSQEQLWHWSYSCIGASWSPYCCLHGRIGWRSTRFRVGFSVRNYKWFFWKIYTAVLGLNLIFDRTGPKGPVLWSPVQGSTSWPNWSDGPALGSSEMPAELDRTGLRHH